VGHKSHDPSSMYCISYGSRGHDFCDPRYFGIPLKYESSQINFGLLPERKTEVSINCAFDALFEELQH